MQCRDCTGKARNCGGDAVSLTQGGFAVKAKVRACYGGAPERYYDAKAVQSAGPCPNILAVIQEDVVPMLWCQSTLLLWA